MQRLIFQEPQQPEKVLSRFEVCSTDSLEDARYWGEKILCQNDLQLPPGLTANSVIHTNIYYRRLAGIGFGRMSYGADLVIKPAAFEDFILIQMPIRGRESIELNGMVVSSTPDQGVIINQKTRSLFHHSSDTEKLILRVDQELINRSCQTLLGRTLKDDVNFTPAMAFGSHTGQQWLRMMSWAFDFLSEDWELSSVMQSQIKSNIINTLLASQPHNYSDDLLNDTPMLTPHFVKRIEKYIEENAHLPLTINDLAEFAGVSARTLFTGFSRYRNTTPMRYLKEVRLQYVYEELRNAVRGQHSVTDIALKWGFSHLGHFGTDYKRRFGESPSATLMR